MDTTRPWQLQIVEKSLKKKQKIRHLLAGLALRPSDTALDLGCAQGMLSYHLRRAGGSWVSADQDWTNLKTTQGLVGAGLVRVEPVRLPFRGASFDLVALPDYLEHVEDDAGLLSELARVVRPGGRLIVVVPETGRLRLVHRLRAALGMRLEFYGHKREGYTFAGLAGLLGRAGFEVSGRKTYAKFFSEFFELVLNALYVRFLGPGAGTETLRDGRIRPSTGGEFAAGRSAFRLYSLVYPFVWLASQLDHLLFFLEGNSLIVWARKPKVGL